MTQPLAGIHVVELAQGIAGPYAGKLFADFGADVVKIEPADGDRSRQVGPFPESGPDPEQGALFLHLNTNKRSVVAEPESDLFAQLIGTADLVIQSEPSPDPAQLRAEQPGAVVLTVTPFGLTGPYAGYQGEEIVHYAFGGPMASTGGPEREPLKMGGNIGQYQCGTVGAVAAMAALRMAVETGNGTHIDLANTETQICSIDRRMAYLLYGSYRNANTLRSGGYSTAPFPIGVRPTMDGHVQISTLMNWIPRMLAVVDDPEMSAIYDDPMWLFDESTPEKVDAQTLMWSLTRTRQGAMEEAQAQGWPVTTVNRPVDLLVDPHFADREFFQTIDHPGAGEVRQPGPQFRMYDGWSVRHPAPRLGEHTDEVAAEMRTRPVRPVVQPDEPRLPLEGLRVLDMTVVWAGPYTTFFLGDLGADVVRVDNPWVFPSATRGVLPRPPKEILNEGDGIFAAYPDGEPGERPWNRLGLFNSHARNKRSVTLDLRKDSGREAFLRLVETCDVMVENNSVDLLEKLGIDWDTLHARNPRLILLRMPSAGRTGPYREYLGFGVNFEGLCGLTALRGYPDLDPSEGEAVYHMDAASGSAGAFAVLTALRRRDETGVGEVVELSQSENMLSHIGEYIIDADRTGIEHGTIGNRHPVRAPQGCYPCTGDDGWAVISVGSDDEWAGLSRAAGSPQWAGDARFATAEGRHEHHDELDELIGAWTAELDHYEVFERCQAEGVPAAPVLHDLDALADPHLRERAMFAPNTCEDTGTHDYPTHAWHWDGPDMRFEHLPTLGSDNEAVFKDLLAYSADEYAALEADGHITTDYLDPDGNPL
ncbi:MAG: CoA transferase [Actinomycetia bacterium]|nr:CoA transferase [Actinomycetes bacterium]MCP3912946.1 CoA transferase [Actinomycetes bacterium]MCP4083639.1 CoA transferase [Actinomycetes bacterium]